MTSDWIYVNTTKAVGDPDRLKIFVSRDTADAWFAQGNAKKPAAHRNQQPHTGFHSRAMFRADPWPGTAPASP
jgi:hypothetical protein